MVLRPVALLLVLLAATLSAQQPPPARTISKYDRGASQTMLRQVKADLKEFYYDPTFRGMDLEKTFDEADERLDLRGNGGGAVDSLRAMLSRLFDRDVRIGIEKARKGEKPLEAKGRKDAFSGKLVVLVDSQSGSAAEMLARVVQLEKRGTVIGDRTAGAVMTARIVPHLVGTTSLAFYATTITIGDVRMADGMSLEHVGVTPDETVLPTAADLAAGRDPALARAITLLGGTMTAEQAGRFYRP